MCVVQHFFHNFSGASLSSLSVFLILSNVSGHGIIPGLAEDRRPDSQLSGNYPHFSKDIMSAEVIQYPQYITSLPWFVLFCQDKALDAGEGGELRCRLYENRYPEAEEVVMVNVTEIGEMGAYVTLLEYDNIEVRIAKIGMNLIGYKRSAFSGNDPSLWVITPKNKIDQEVMSREQNRSGHGDTCG